MWKFSRINKFLLITIMVTIFMAACSSLQPQETPTEQPQTIEDVPPIVSATGEAVPAQFSRLSMSVPGMIQEVLVQEGDQVKIGQVLVRLKGKEDLQAAITTAEFDVASAQKELDDIYENTKDAQPEALQAIAFAAKRFRDAQYQLDNFTVPQDQSGLETMEALDLMKGRLDKARAAFEPYKYFSSTNDTREDLKEKLDEAQSDYNSAIKRLEYENDLQAAKVNLDKTRQDYASLLEGPKAKDIAVAEARLSNALATRFAAKAALEDLELRAPFDGTVSELDARQGEWVTPGFPVLLLADLGHLQIETTDLNEIDAARVSIGNPVFVTFDALNNVDIDGVVISIAPKASEGSGVNYTAVIELTSIPDSLRWGMTAFVDIEVEEN